METQDKKKISKELVGELLNRISKQNVTKPGFKTTEFWLTMAAYVLSIIMYAKDANEIIAGGVAAIATAGYSVSRGMCKK